MVSLKTFLITIAVIIAIGVGGYFYMESKFNDAIESVQEDLESEKQEIKEESKKVISERNQTIEQMRTENQEILIQNEKLYEQLRKKSRNPDYDFNFLQSADIISKSKYKPGE